MSKADNLNNAINHVDLVDLHGTQHLIPAQYAFSSVHDMFIEL